MLFSFSFFLFFSLSFLPLSPQFFALCVYLSIGHGPLIVLALGLWGLKVFFYVEVTNVGFEGF